MATPSGERQGSSSGGSSGGSSGDDSGSGGGGSGDGGGDSIVPTEGISRGRSRRVVVLPAQTLAVSVRAEKRARAHTPRRAVIAANPPTPGIGELKPALNASGCEGGPDVEEPESFGGGEGKGEAEGSSKRKKATTEDQMKEEMAELEKEAGVGVYEELEGDATTRLVDLRAIVDWENQPFEMYDSLMPEYGEFYKAPHRHVMGAAGHQQLQKLVRRHLRVLDRTQLADLASTMTAPRVDGSGRGVTDVWWKDKTSAEILGLLLVAAEINGTFRLELSSRFPDVVLQRHVTRHQPSSKALATYFPGEEGAAVLAILNENDIETVEQLRTAYSDIVEKLDLAWNARMAGSPYVAEKLNLAWHARMAGSTSAAVGREPNGPADRVLHMLYEAQMTLPIQLVQRHHAVFEWAIAKRNARDTEVALWRPWLQPGKRVTVKMMHPRPTHSETGRAPTHVETAHKIAIFTGTVVRYNDATGTSGTDSCAVVLDSKGDP